METSILRISVQSWLMEEYSGSVRLPVACSSLSQVCVSEHSFKAMRALEKKSLLLLP